MAEENAKWLSTSRKSKPLKPVTKKTETKKTLVDFDQRKITCFFTKNENSTCFQNTAMVNHSRVTTANEKLIISPAVSCGEFDASQCINEETKCKTAFNEFRAANNGTETFLDAISFDQTISKPLLTLNSNEGTEKCFSKHRTVCLTSERLKVNDNVKITAYNSKNEDVENEQPLLDFMDTCNSEELCLETGDFQPFVPRPESFFTSFLSL